MYLTTDILHKHNSCKEGLAWFSRHYPNGGELIDVINHPKVSPAFLHWGFNNLTINEEEQAAYRARLNVNCGEFNYSIYESDNIQNSYIISRSSRVEDSSYIFKSSDVLHSNSVTGSETVEDSNKIYNSSFVFNSKKVLYSKNITDSIKIVNSDYVVGSENVFNSSVITNSHFITSLMEGNSRNITDSWFVFEGENLSNCLFCSHLKDAEYHLFNKPIAKAHYDNIVRQLARLLKDVELHLVDSWPSSQIPLDTPRINRNIILQYADFPDRFWEWVKTLPGYDSSVLYSITYQSKLL